MQMNINLSEVNTENDENFSIPSNRIQPSRCLIQTNDKRSQLYQDSCTRLMRSDFCSYQRLIFKLGTEIYLNKNNDALYVQTEMI